jgi:hypothetical protein
LKGQARLAHGDPSITATLVNTKVPVTSYASWFSYLTIDFLSQNKEIEQAFTNTVRLYPDQTIRFVGDSGLEDQKMFAQVVKLEQEFVFRVCHLERIVEVYNDRLDRWETEKLQDLVKVFLSRPPSRYCSSTLEKPDSTRFILAGSRFASQAHKNRCGSWWLMMKLWIDNWS